MPYPAAVGFTNTSGRNVNHFKLLVAGIVLVMMGAALPAASAESPSSDRGIQTAISDVVGGVEADRLEYPFMAALIWTEAEGVQGDALDCGGSAISDTWILTAAHCILGDQAILMGGHELTASQGQLIEICDAIVHPGGPADDVALVELCEPHHHPTIRLAQTAGDAAKGTEATVAGWGLIESDPEEPVIPTTPYEADVVIRGPKNCKNKDEADFFVKANTICALGEGMDGVHDFADACNGDSGGPLIVEDEDGPLLIGVVSYGPLDCADRNFPGYYMRVSHYLPWITEVTGITGTDAAAGVPCGGLYATVLGTNGPDTLKGSSRADVIVGLGGKDTIKGLGNDDVICGGGGADVIQGGNGDDMIFGGKGKDTCKGGKGKDVLAGC